MLRMSLLTTDTFATFRLSLFEIVFFFPVFYLQLYSIQKGLSSTFSFYSVCPHPFDSEAETAMHSH